MPREEVKRSEKAPWSDLVSPKKYGLIRGKGRLRSTFGGPFSLKTLQLYIEIDESEQKTGGKARGREGNSWPRSLSASPGQASWLPHAYVIYIESIKLSAKTPPNPQNRQKALTMIDFCTLSASSRFPATGWLGTIS